MHLNSRNGQITYVLSRNIRSTVGEPRRVLQMMALWGVMLALVLLVLVAMLSLASWWDETQTTFLVSEPRVHFSHGKQKPLGEGAHSPEA
jgi:hypothetical protein